jgi:predicted RecA/RadA family phage recombinase
MADSQFVVGRGFDASAAITKARAVKPHATLAETVSPVTAEGDEVIGVAEFDVSTADIARGKGCSVQMMGIVEMEAAATIAVGDSVCIDSSGRAVAVNTGGRVVGMCVGHPGDSGDRISVMLWLPGIIAA